VAYTWSRARGVAERLDLAPVLQHIIITRKANLSINYKIALSLFYGLFSNYYSILHSPINPSTGKFNSILHSRTGMDRSCAPCKSAKLRSDGLCFSARRVWKWTRMCRLKALNVFDERYVYFTTSADYTRDLQRWDEIARVTWSARFLFSLKRCVRFLSRNARVIPLRLLWHLARGI